MLNPLTGPLGQGQPSFTMKSAFKNLRKGKHLSMESSKQQVKDSLDKN